jgi:hypothetical protein
LACLRGWGARIVGDTAALNAIENIEQAHISLLTWPDPDTASRTRMTVARRLLIKRRWLPLRYAQTINPVISLAAHRQASLADNDDAVCRIPAHPLVRAHWQIDLRRRSKWAENDCFDEI